MQKINQKIKYILLPLLLLAGGCTKEEHTLPVNFNLQFVVDDKPVMDGLLTVENIIVNLNSIEIEGRRTVGEDVFLNREFDNGHHLELKMNSPSESIDLNLPQGVYNRLSFLLNFKEDMEEEGHIEELQEWLEDVEEGGYEVEELQEDLGDILEDYLEEIQPSIMLKAKYQRNEIHYHVLFVVNDPLRITVLSKNSSGNKEITLQKDILNTGKLVFDPSYWFSLISPSMLESAFQGVTDNEKYIFIHKKVNPQLFTVIYNRLEESTILFVNE